MKNKTTEQWLKGIKDPNVRNMALKNMDDEETNERCSDLSEAIMGAFIFSNTPEGIDYWWNIMDVAELGGNIPKGEYTLIKKP